MASQGIKVARPVDAPSFTKDATVSVEELATQDEVRYFVQSPYTDKEHLLDLTTVNNENGLLARALASLESVRDDYATAPYTESFNWDVVLGDLKRLAKESGKKFHETSFYIVAFRSQLKPSTDISQLEALDKAAHAEAIASGGFLKYWYGSPDPEFRNLATCIWRTREDALIGGRGEAHRKAAASTRAAYAFWKIDQHRLVVKDNVDSWEIVPWNE